jgi:2-polyprenyl-3-methyl-5-hydroxy-6-metoxy-1,4-benzoquinol methylase
LAIQSREDLDKFYSNNNDPWNYSTNSDDQLRKNYLFANLPRRLYERTLDIGCGNGFVTLDLPGREIVGVDISQKAVEHAISRAKDLQHENMKFLDRSIFDLSSKEFGRFDLVVITGVLYPQYIGKARSIIYKIVDDLLDDEGILISCHINEWSPPRFPYINLDTVLYQYREYTHRLEVYKK